MAGEEWQVKPHVTNIILVGFLPLLGNKKKFILIGNHELIMGPMDRRKWVKGK